MRQNFCHKGKDKRNNLYLKTWFQPHRKYTALPVKKKKDHFFRDVKVTVIWTKWKGCSVNKGEQDTKRN
jgi:hypothetical protein